LLPHIVETAYERAWATLRNGELLQAAESAGFDVMITTDKNLRHQQNVAERRIAVVVLRHDELASYSRGDGRHCERRRAVCDRALH
jgi:rRNA-processing protein FCF1